VRVAPRHALFVLTVLAMLQASCGSATSTTPSPQPTSPAGGTPSSVVITITQNGVSPKNVTVPLGSQVTFVNNDTIAHLMFSDPHPEHTDCPDLNQVGFLAPGESRQTGNLNVARTCGFHDHDLPLVAGLHGSITSQ